MQEMENLYYGTIVFLVSFVLLPQNKDENRNDPYHC